jgi:hypothetical protein
VSSGGKPITAPMIVCTKGPAYPLTRSVVPGVNASISSLARWCISGSSARTRAPLSAASVSARTCSCAGGSVLTSTVVSGTLPAFSSATTSGGLS